MHPFLVESKEQGKVLKDCLDAYLKEGIKSLEDIYEAYKKGNYKKIVFSGMGSSYYAPYSVAGYLTEHGVPSVVINAAELSGPQFNLIDKETLIIIVSQSGNSPEVIDLLKKVYRQFTVVGIVNNEESYLGTHCDFKIPMLSGYEDYISSKSYLNSIVILQILAAKLTGALNNEFQDSLYNVARWTIDMLENFESNKKDIMNFVNETKIFDFIGNYSSISTINQAALIFREGPRYPTAAIMANEYSHGCHLLNKKGSTLVIFDYQCKEGTVEEAMRKYAIKNEGKVIVITCSEKLLSTEDMKVITYPSVPEWIAPAAQIIPCTKIMGWLLEAMLNDN